MMPGSAPDFREDIKRYLCDYPRDSRIIDIGAGKGTYADLLREHFDVIDGCEIFVPYIEEYGLEDKYNQIHIVHARYMHYSDYDIVIFGAVIEHMQPGMAQYILERACNACKEVVVVVPYLCKQGPVSGNRFEIHIQDDLTSEIMRERYPMLREWKRNNKRGVYLKR